MPLSRNFTSCTMKKRLNQRGYMKQELPCQHISANEVCGFGERDSFPLYTGSRHPLTPVESSAHFASGFMQWLCCNPSCLCWPFLWLFGSCDYFQPKHAYLTTERSWIVIIVALGKCYNTYFCTGDILGSVYPHTLDKTLVAELGIGCEAINTSSAVRQAMGANVCFFGDSDKRCCT